MLPEGSRRFCAPAAVHGIERLRLFSRRLLTLSPQHTAGLHPHRGWVNPLAQDHILIDALAFIPAKLTLGSPKPLGHLPESSTEVQIDVIVPGLARFIASPPICMFTLQR